MPEQDNDLQRLARCASAEYAKLRQDNEVLAAVMDLTPIPMWVKRVELNDDGDPIFRMLRTNLAYERRWGVPRDFYAGRFDYEVWGRPIADQFHAHDLQALQEAPAPVIADEIVPDYAPMGGPEIAACEKTPVWRIVKVSALVLEARYVVGVAWRPNEGDDVESLARSLRGDQVDGP